MTEHPSALELTQLSVDDLAGDARAAVSEHVAACSICRDQIAALAAERETLHARLPPKTFAAGVAASVAARRGRRPSRRLLAGSAFGALAMAAALVLFVRPASDTRWKGGGIAVHRQRDGRVSVLGADEGVRAGDGLRITLATQQRSRARAWIIDAAGRVDHVTEGAISISSGVSSLGESVTVDAPCVDLWIVIGLGVHAEADVESLVRGAASVPRATEALRQRGFLIEPLRCE